MAGLIALPLPTHSPAPSAPGTTAWLQAASVGPIGQLGAEGPAPSSQQRHRKASLPVREMGRQGRTPPPHQQPLPREPPAPAWLCLAAIGRAMGCPSPGVGGQLLLGAKPHGAQSHIPRSWPRPTFDLTHSVHFRKSRTLCPPASSLSTPGLLSSLMGSKRQVTDTPCHLQCRGARLQPVSLTCGSYSVEAPQQDGLGSWSVSSPTSLFLFMFLFTNWSGVLRGAGQHSPALGCHQESFGSSPSAELDSTFPVTPPRTTL